MIIITGASRGLGKYIFNHFEEKGEEVVGLYNTTLPDVLNSNYYQLDITDESAVVQFVDKLSLANIVLINLAGISNSSIAHKQSIDDFKETFNVNTIAPFSLIRYLLPYMRKQGYGRIINISSVVAQIGTPGNVAYAASKAALWGMSRVIAIENATKGITSNCLNVGYCSIGMIDKIPLNILNSIIETIPQKRLCDPSNIVNAIEFLINSDYVTGAEININGGLY